MQTLAAVAMMMLPAACADDYDDSALWDKVNDHEERLAALEKWQEQTNQSIAAMQELLNTTDMITGVSAVTEDGQTVGYTITFLQSDPITIYNGAKGADGEDGADGADGQTPQIGLAQAEDGNWYWTLNGELLTDTDGNPIRANGTQGEQGEPGPAGDDAPLPQLATGKKLNEQQITTDSQNNPIAADAIYLSVDGGKTWTRVSGEDGEKGDTGNTGATGPKGDSFFESVDTTNADYVIFKLANNGGTFQVPRYTGISLTFNPTSLSLLYDETKTIKCTAEGSAEFTTDNLFVVAPAGWKADIALTRSASTGFTLTVTAPADITSGVATGEILVMLDNKKGSTTIGRIPVACTQITLDNVSEGQLAKLIGSRTDLTSITVTSGTLNDADWNAIRQNEWALRTLDLEGATYNTSDLKYVKMLYIDPVPLTTAKLPQGVTVLGIDAFVKCNNLTSIELPASLTKIGLAAFYSCSKLASITCRAAMPPEMSTSVLLGVTSLFEIQVPAESVEAYKQAYAWSAYADKIVAIPEP